MAPNKKLTYDPDDVTHPGESLRAYMEAEDLSVEDMVPVLRAKGILVQMLLDGDARFTPRIAANLGGAGIGTEEFWLSRQERYDEVHPPDDPVSDAYEAVTEARQWAVSVLRKSFDTDVKRREIMDEVFDVMDEWLLENDMLRCNAAFAQWCLMIEQAVENLAVALGALTVTNGARSKLPGRQEFVEALEERMHETMTPKNIEAHLYGLR